MPRTGALRCPPCLLRWQAAFHNSVAKWVVLNSKRAVTVLHPYRLGHHKTFTPKQGHPAHAKVAK